MLSGALVLETREMCAEKVRLCGAADDRRSLTKIVGLMKPRESERALSSSLKHGLFKSFSDATRTSPEAFTTF